MPQPQEQYAIVTGASSGIGFAFAQVLGSHGYKIVAISSNPARLADATKIIKSQGTEVTALVRDLSKSGAAESVARFLKSNKIRADVLVNNAGFATAGSFTKTDFVQESAEMQLNMVALTQLTKLLLPPMIQRRQGKILNVSSMAAFQPGPYMAVYYATKAYVLHFSEALSEELKGSGVTVSALCPGATASNFASRAGIANSHTFSGRLPSSEEIAKAGYVGLMAGTRVIIPGWKNRVLVSLSHLAPRALILRYLATLQK